MHRLALVLLTTALLIGRAAAADFSTVLMDMDGNPIRDEATKSLTLGRAAAHALIAPFSDEPNITGDEKVLRFSLALRLREARDVTPTAEETALVKKLIAKAYGPLIVGRAWQLLDPPSVK